MTTNNSELAVFAHIDGQWESCGQLILREERDELCTSLFEFNESYSSGERSISLDPLDLFISGPPYTPNTLLAPKNGLPYFGALRDATPDSWGRRVIEAKLDAPLNGLRESQYMLHASSDRVGMIDVRRTFDDPPLEQRDDSSNLENLAQSAGLIEQGSPIADKQRDIFAQGVGLGGARPKVSIRDEEGVLWLAKFSSLGDRFAIPAVECATLRMAAKAGLRVPDVTTVRVGERDVMLIRRFDRFWKIPGTAGLDEVERMSSFPGADLVEHRTPFISALTLIGCDESESRNVKYSDLAAMMLLYCHPDIVRSDMRELYRRMVFNVFTTCDDDHLRNHGFTWDEMICGWRLSPLYDVVPRPSVSSERYLHLGVGAQGRLATIDNALTEHFAFGLSEQDAAEAILEVWGVVQDWRRHYDASGVDGKDIQTIAPAFRSIDDVASEDVRRALLKT
ncbi:HipA domain-containing protein [Caballeronia sp. LZ043]|uniref:type II toxin-antitoxin system HipA family toxin n=1 Tax=Caballeronia sp. LZ043 TaxID=3038569 RepID=UPI00285DA13D|nr:HipA domain-containing protein [Caballeronia sp. LZ043]MDR5819302.1 HipA domain-containing protein [Caballeronia sp. LZ043]